MYHLNQPVTGAEDPWMPIADWEACEGDPVFRADLRTYAAVRVAHDHRAAAVAVAQHQGERVVLRVRTFPESHSRKSSTCRQSRSRDRHVAFSRAVREDLWLLLFVPFRNRSSVRVARDGRESGSRRGHTSTHWSASQSSSPPRNVPGTLPSRGFQLADDPLDPASSRVASTQWSSVSACS